MKHTDVNQKGIFMILINALCVKLFLTFPRNIILNSGNAVWIQCIYVSVLAAVILWVTDLAYKGIEKYDVLDLSEKLCGKAGKIVVGLIVCCILTANISMSVRIFPESVRLYLLPTTPTEVILLFLAAAAAVGAYCGMQALARLHALFIPFAAVVMALFFICLLPQCHTENLFPIFGTGTYNIFLSGLNGLSLFSDVLLFNLMLPYCGDIKIGYSRAIRAAVYSGTAAVIIAVIYALIYPYPMSSKFIMPVYQLIRLVKIGDFFRRAEALFEFVWSIATIMYISVYVCIICMTFAKTFSLPYYKTLIVPAVTAVCAIALAPSSAADVIESDSMIKNIIYPIVFLLPIAVAVLTKIKSRERGA